MTKKHYEAIAAILSKHNATDKTLVASAARCLADYFATDNKNFDRARFLASCGIIESYPCERCHGVRDVEARICSKCIPK
jgi:hypothetical protein